MSEENVVSNEAPVEASEGTSVGEVQGSSLLGGGDALTEKPAESTWHDALPDDLRGSPSLKDFKSVNDLAKSYLNAQSLIGRSVRIPGENASQEDWENFYSRFDNVPGMTRIDDENPEQVLHRLGMPYSPDEYDWTPPEGFDYSPEDDTDFRQVAYDLGLTTKQAAGIRDYLAQNIMEDESSSRQSVEEGINGLRQEWGAAFDRNMSIAQNAVQVLGGEEVIQYLEETGAGNDPAMIKLFAAIGAELGEPGSLPGEGADAVMTPADALLEISEIQNNPEHPYHKGDEAAVDKMKALFEFAYPSQVA